MPSRQANLQLDTYFRVMRILQESPDLIQRELVEGLGVSVGGLNYCLKALVEKGWVKMQSFSRSKSKFGYVYLLPLQGIAQKASLTSSFIARKMAEYDASKSKIEIFREEEVEQQASLRSISKD